MVLSNNHLLAKGVKSLICYNHFGANVENLVISNNCFSNSAQNWFYHKTVSIMKSVAQFLLNNLFTNGAPLDRKIFFITCRATTPGLSLTNATAGRGKTELAELVEPVELSRNDFDSFLSNFVSFHFSSQNFSVLV